MSNLSSSRPSARRRRADGLHSRAAILDAARRVWSARPEARLEEIAAAAGVTRQTVYAHYASRELLLGAISERARAEAIAALDAAALDDDPPAAALARLLRASWQTFARYPFLRRSATTPVSVQEAHESHEPINERLERLIGRGQNMGDFERRLSPTWLLAAMVGLLQAAHEEVSAGRMTAEDAAAALEHSILRVFRADGAPAADADA
jgi:AcrR family transcriptional regulator